MYLWLWNQINSTSSWAPSNICQDQPQHSIQSTIKPRAEERRSKKDRKSLIIINDDLFLVRMQYSSFNFSIKLMQLLLQVDAWLKERPWNNNTVDVQVEPALQCITCKELGIGTWCTPWYPLKGFLGATEGCFFLHNGVSSQCRFVWRS